MEEGKKEPQSKTMMMLICFFLGAWGIHRLMMGYKNWWLMLVTFGGFGIWTLYDLVMIAMGKMNMADGTPLS